MHLLDVLRGVQEMYRSQTGTGGVACVVVGLSQSHWLYVVSNRLCVYWLALVESVCERCRGSGLCNVTALPKHASSSIGGFSAARIPTAVAY